MEQETLIYIDDKQKFDASVMANTFADKDTKNRVYINTLGAELLKKYLQSEDIVYENSSIHNIKKVIEEFDISDISAEGLHIDVRVVFDENVIYIPKSHFDYDILPDIYVVLKLCDDLTNVKMLGFFEPQLINKNNANKDYYFIEKEKLSSALDFVPYIKKNKKTKTNYLTEEIEENCEKLIISMIDNDINETDKKELLKGLLEDNELTEQFIEYENFETLSHKAMTNSSIEKQETLKDTFVRDEFDLFEDNSSDISNLSENDIVDSDESTNFAENDLSELTDMSEYNSYEEEKNLESTENTDIIENDETDDTTFEPQNENDKNDNLISETITGITEGIIAGSSSAIADETLTEIGNSVDAVAESINIAENITESHSDSVEVQNCNDTNSQESSIHDNQTDIEIEPIENNIELNIDDSFIEPDLVINNSLDEPAVEIIPNDIDNIDETIISEDINNSADDTISEPISDFVEDSDISDIENNSEYIANDNYIDEPISLNNAENVTDDIVESDSLKFETEDNINVSDEQSSEQTENFENVIEPESIESIEENSEFISFDNITENNEYVDNSSEPENIEDETISLDHIEEPESTDYSDISDNQDDNGISFDSINEYNSSDTQSQKEETTSLEELEQAFSEDSQNEQSSFGKNLLDNLSQEEQDAVSIEEIEEIFSDDKTSQDDDDYDYEEDNTIKDNEDDDIVNEDIENDEISETTQDSNSEIDKIPVDQSEESEISPVEYNFIENTESEENNNDIADFVQTSENTVGEEISDNIELINSDTITELSENTFTEESDNNKPENKLDLLYNEDEKSDIDLNNINELEELPEKAEKTGPKAISEIKTLFSKIDFSDRRVIFAAVIFALVISLGTFQLIRSTHEEPIGQEEISSNLDENQDITPNENIMEENIPDISNQTQNVQSKPIQQTQELSNNPTQQNPKVTNVDLNVSKLVWDVPDYIAKNPAVQNYLRTAGKSIKVSLSADLLLANEYAYSNYVKINLNMSPNGNIKHAGIASSSGSKQIDNIVLQSVKDTLNTVKPSGGAIQGPDFNLSIIIYF